MARYHDAPSDMFGACRRRRCRGYSDLGDHWQGPEYSLIVLYAKISVKKSFQYYLSVFKRRLAEVELFNKTTVPVLFSVKTRNNLEDIYCQYG
jgi:hypothetical protein